MGFKDFFGYERKQEAQDQRISEKKAVQKAAYVKWADKANADIDFAQALETLELEVKKFEKLDNEFQTAKMHLNNQKMVIQQLLKANTFTFFDKKQHLILGDYKVGYTNNLKPILGPNFSVVKYLEEFDESTLSFQLSKTQLKAVEKSKTLRKMLKDLEIEITYEEEYYIHSQSYL